MCKVQYIMNKMLKLRKFNTSPELGKKIAVKL